jgi:hypothetical protein
MVSPFIYGKIVSGVAFTDREKEQERLSKNFLSGINTILISPRRWGKSSLVTKVGESLRQKNKTLRFCYLDLFNIRSEEEFYDYFIRELLRVTYSRWEERMESAKKFLRTITPKFSLGIDPEKDFSISLDWEEIKRAPEEILNLPEVIGKQKKIQIIVCIDEFQNIGFFSDPTAFQKKLRSQWQHHKTATYCLYGSKRHLMMELFENKSMPFYKFGDVIFLEKISEPYWIQFITNQFKATEKTISPELAMQIARQMENHPYFVQQYAHAVWQMTAKVCSEKELTNALELLLVQNTILFQREVDSLTNSQINFLKALSDGVEQFSATHNLKKYHLGTSGNVNRIKESLINKEIIDISSQKIEFIDPLFKAWFTTIYSEK